jgi:hypothetical protein
MLHAEHIRQANQALTFARKSLTRETYESDNRLIGGKWREEYMGGPVVIYGDRRYTLAAIKADGTGREMLLTAAPKKAAVEMLAGFFAEIWENTPANRRKQLA